MKGEDTAVFSTRVSVKDMASIAYAFDLLGIEYNSRSSLVNVALRHYKETLQDVMSSTKEKDIEFATTEDAINYLKLNKRLGLGTMRLTQAVGGAMKKRMAGAVAQVQDSERVEELEAVEELDKRGIPEHLQEK